MDLPPTHTPTPAADIGLVSQKDKLIAVLPNLTAYVMRAVSDRHAAREILQEVSLRVLGGRGPDERDRFLAWCFGIVRHVMAHEWRSRRRARDELPLDGKVLEELRAPQPDPDRHVDARAWVRRASHDIDRDGFELLVRRYVLEETGSELAEELAQTSAALRMRLMRLRSTLLTSTRT